MDMEQEGSQDAAARGSARANTNRVMHSPSMDENLQDDGEDSSDGEGGLEVSKHSSECTGRSVHVCKIWTHRW